MIKNIVWTKLNARMFEPFAIKNTISVGGLVLRFELLCWVKPIIIVVYVQEWDGADELC